MINKKNLSILGLFLLSITLLGTLSYAKYGNIIPYQNKEKANQSMNTVLNSKKFNKEMNKVFQKQSGNSYSLQELSKKSMAGKKGFSYNDKGKDIVIVPLFTTEANEKEKENAKKPSKKIMNPTYSNYGYGKFYNSFEYSYLQGETISYFEIFVPVSY